MTTRLAERIAALPPTPGVYLFKNARGRVLYVGKAQNLRSRVRSYFSSGGDGRPQVPRLVERIADLDVVLTASVRDALLLENELIKRHRPPFNVRLRDDKQYLALRLDLREPWPRLTGVRRFRDDGADYFGPYTSSQSMRQAVSNLRRIFPLRSCSDAVFRDYARRGRPCIEYDMKRCLAPCVGRVDAATYGGLVRGTQLFLRGRSEELAAGLREQMVRAAAEERFEDAGRLRDQLAAVERTAEQQPIVAPKLVDRDVFGVARRGEDVEVQVLHVRDGRVSGAASHALSDVQLDDGALMSSFLGQYYGSDEHGPVPGEVLTPVAVEDDGGVAALLRERAGHRVVLRVPRRGAARELVRMAERNAELGLARRLDARESLDAVQAELRERLGLRRLPRRIECYDVSNLNGVLPVASRVVFEDGRPVKAAFRRYRIREATGGDDAACLREVLDRRLARAQGEPLPDLLLVDGGKAQVAVASAALRDGGFEVDLLGLAKERDTQGPAPRVRRSGGLKAERIFVPGRKDPILLAPGSRALLQLQRIRDESHRFAIEFQRSLRQRLGMTSILEELPGIGPGKRRALLRALGSLRAVREASTETLAAVPGISVRDAATLHAFFHPAQSAAEDGPIGGAGAPGTDDRAGDA